MTTRRLLVVGLLLLTLGFVVGFLLGPGIVKVKLWFSVLIWLLYTGLALDSWSGRLGNRRTAQGAILIFLLALLLLPLIQRLSVLG
jgi:hypothetical protein